MNFKCSQGKQAQLICLQKECKQQPFKCKNCKAHQNCMEQKNISNKLNDLDFMSQLLKTLKKQKQFQQIQQYLKKIKSEEYRLQTAKKYQRQEDYKNAFQSYKQYYEGKKLTIEQNIKLSQLALKSGSVSLALSYIVEAKRQYPQRYDLYLRLADIYISGGQKADAIGQLKILEQYDLKEQNNVKIQIIAMNKLIRLSDQQEQKRKYSLKLVEKLDRFPNISKTKYFKIYQDLIQYYQQKKQNQLVLKYIEIALTIYPTPQNYFLKAKIMYQSWNQSMGKEVLANIQLQLNKAINMKQFYTEARTLRARCLYYQRQFVKAREDFTTLIQQQRHLNFVHKDDYYKLGKCEFSLGNYNEAQTCYRQSLKIQPTYDYALLGLAETLKNLGKYEQALNNLKQINQSNIQWKKNVLQLQGNIYWQWGKQQQAFNIYITRFLKAQNCFKEVYNIERNQKNKKDYVNILKQLNRNTEAEQIQRS